MHPLDNPEYRKRLARYKRGQAIGRAAGKAVSYAIALVAIWFIGYIALTLIAGTATFVQSLGILLIVVIPSIASALIRERPADK